MRRLLIVATTAFLAVVFSSCNRPANVKALLENPETRSTIYSTIIEDHQMMNDFIGQMMASEHGSMMMQNHPVMKNWMMEGGHMMNMMRQDPNAMNQIIQDGHMMGRMIQMMNQNGMMSDECLQSTMQMMKEKGAGVENMKMKGNQQ